MEKISRLLFLYTKLKKGERINKINYCMEYECSPRAFDRDVEDIRLFLSESYSATELIYDRRYNEYYLTVSESPALDIYDFFVTARTLLLSSSLREDELTELLRHLAIRSERSDYCMKWALEKMEDYKSPNKAAIIKTFGDLEIAIEKQQVICIKYIQTDDTVADFTVVPCEIGFGPEDGAPSLCALDYYKRTKKQPDYYALARIESFLPIENFDEETKKRVYEFKSTYGEKR